MKNAEIIKNINALGTFTKDKVPAKLSFAIVKNLNKLKVVYQDYDQARIALVNAYSKKDDKGNNLKDGNGFEILKEEYVSNWDEEIKELLEIEIDFEIHFINFSILENLQLAVSDMDAIEFMIKEE